MENGIFLKNSQGECKKYNYLLIKLILDDNVVYGEIGERPVEDEFLKQIEDARIYDTEFEFEYYEEFISDGKTGKLRYFERQNK